MGGQFSQYLHALWSQALLSWRKGAVIMTVLISLALIAGLYLGWHLSAYPSSYFLIGTGAIATFDVLAIFPYQLWKANTAKIGELEERLRPKIQCSFDMNNPACVRANTQVMILQNNTIATWYARLLSIKRANAELLYGETPFLPFAPMQDVDATQKLVTIDIPEYVDFLWVNDTHGARIITVGIMSQVVQWDSLFDAAGDYSISIVVTHSGSPSPAKIHLKFSWTLDPLTSRITFAQ
jgi:hypothetical protein